MHRVKQPSSDDAFFREPEFKKFEPFPSGIFSDCQEAAQLNTRRRRRRSLQRDVKAAHIPGRHVSGRQRLLDTPGCGADGRPHLIQRAKCCPAARQHISLTRVSQPHQRVLLEVRPAHSRPIVAVRACRLPL